MRFNLNLVSKIIFLLFIIIISIYFLIANKDYENFVDGETQQETNFIPNDKETIYTIIKDIYIELYMTDPPPKISDFYYTYVSQRNITKEQLKEVIAGSNQTLAATFAETNYTIPSNPALYGTEDDVIQVYSEILFRNPDETELSHFAQLLKEDKDFSLDKLKQILYSSEEYKRLEKTQTNTAYSNIIGGVTDRQLTLIVTTVYKDVTGKELPDTDTLHLLKKKLVDFNIDQNALKEFIKNYIDNKPYNYTPKLVQTTQENVVSKDTNTVSKDDFDLLKKDIMSQVTQALQNIPKKTDQGFTTNGKEVAQVNPNRQVIEVLLRTAKDSTSENYLDSQNIVNKIKEEAKCAFDKDAVDNYYKSLGASQDMAELQDKRNTEELGYTCNRNQKFMAIDQDLVLDPSLKWTIPTQHPPICVGNKKQYKPIADQTALIGTLLEDANETTVGSILPEQPPR